MALFVCHFAANNFDRWGSPDQSISSKDLTALMALVIAVGKVANDSLFKAFNQGAFTALAVFQ